MSKIWAIVGLFLAAFGLSLLSSLVVAAFFVWGNHSAMVLPILQKLGIAGLNYSQYLGGSIILTFICWGILPHNTNNNNK